MSTLEKSLTIIQLLAERPNGLSVSLIAQKVNQPASGVHRTLNELIRLGYVRQVQDQGDYALTMKLAALGVGFLGRTGVGDVAQPIIDRLAQKSGELVRLSVIDAEDLIWVAVAQGATGGLRYDPGAEQGVIVHLASSAGGQAWLASMSDDEALQKVSRQGLTNPDRPTGPGAPRTITQLLRILAETRERGYAVSSNSYTLGMTAMAVPVRSNGQVISCLSIAGPAVRMSPERMEEMAAPLTSAAEEIGMAATGSRYFPGLHSKG
ncbi:IclR family transcriptional regulator [Rhizobium halophilum]|uniref:IclR family transcriptional regulator n=1 Tax=Rhizobium halophilum TaxID=2846852 RepID=UPI001EFD6BB7|nr:IclR family transcriptional regulator [Rhizobium halophilum]MCF6370836.1 IclR family transcriptional regulator [Rhizobium halophilum]